MAPAGSGNGAAAEIRVACIPVRVKHPLLSLFCSAEAPVSGLVSVTCSDAVELASFGVGVTEESEGPGSVGSGPSGIGDGRRLSPPGLIPGGSVVDHSPATDE